MAFLFVPPCSPHAWVADPWNLDSEVCLYCSAKREDVATFQAAVEAIDAIEAPSPVEIAKIEERPPERRRIAPRLWRELVRRRYG